MSNARLHNYVTRVAFNMSLSDTMIAVLLDIELWDGTTGERPSTRHRLFVPGFRSLEARGLAYHIDPTKNGKWPEGPFPFHLTRAGQLMCDLIVEAGLAKPVKERRKELTRSLKKAA